METSDEADTRAFWSLIGSSSSSWDTFSATFETYMRRNYADEMSQLPSTTRAEAEMVLRYAFDRGNPARAAAGEHVTTRHLALFLSRFGPMRDCLLKAARSLFDEFGCLVPWFHGQTSRDEAIYAIEEWEAARRGGRQQRGVFLFRYSDRQPTISFSYRRRKGDKKIVACLIDNGPRGYSLRDDNPVFWQDLREFVREKMVDFVYPVPSALHLECKEEIESRPSPVQVSPTPDPRQLYAEAQALVLNIGTGIEATWILEKALSLVSQVELILGQLEEGEPQLQVKALRLGGDILWRLHREEEGVASYLRCLNVVHEAEKLQDAVHEDSPVVTASVLSHVHQLLAEYFLRQGSPARGLDHFSELMACTTNEDARRQLVTESRRTDDFHRAMAGLTHSSVEAVLDEGISYFRKQDYGPAGEKFEKVVRDARCIGEGKLEARALGNLATVDYKTHRIPAAIRRYKTCVQLLRQQGDQVTERKILNYLVMCCIEAQRWAPAKLFHEQLSKLAESEQNIRHLRRLQGLIEEGMALQAAVQHGGAAPSGGGGGGDSTTAKAAAAAATTTTTRKATPADTGGASSYFPSQGAAPAGDSYQLYAAPRHHHQLYLAPRQQGAPPSGSGGGGGSRDGRLRGPAPAAVTGDSYQLYAAPRQHQVYSAPRRQEAPPSGSDGVRRDGQLRGPAPAEGGGAGLHRAHVRRQPAASAGGAGGRAVGHVDDYVLVSPDPPPPPPPQRHYGPYSHR